VCLQRPDTSDDTLSNLPHTPRYNSTTTNEMEARDKKTIDWMMVMNGIDDWIGLDWVGLDWIGLDWIGLDWIGLDWRVSRGSRTTSASFASLLALALSHTH